MTPDDLRVLRRWVRSGLTPQRLVRRAQIVLLCDEGLTDREVAARLLVHRHTVALWRQRFADGGADALEHDRPGRGRKPRRGPANS